ncbi:MAG TPA: endonuclease [Candidatus Hydrogenedentes bacterium]|nr:endonuclease [Candidatus Hydrogenedentota bacterium]
MGSDKNRYVQLIERIFMTKHKKGTKEVSFERQDIIQTAHQLGIQLPKNIGDVIYSFRYRSALPASIRKKAPEGLEWVIRPSGKAQYKFALTTLARIIPTSMLGETKIPDSTPGIITKYAIDDEQGLLAKIRYNRLIDIFTGVTCYSLQNHLRTTVPTMGQVETDEVYVGIDQRGVQYVFPIQAKGGSDQLGIVQIEQDFTMCVAKFPDLLCKPIAAQFMENDLIALFAFEENEAGVAIGMEKHYRLVPPEEIKEEDLAQYRSRCFEIHIQT